MVEYKQHNPARLNQVFAALADATRRQLVAAIAERECTITELAEPFDMSLAAVSKHVRILETAGLIRRRIDGRTHYCSLRPEQLSDALDWISIYRNFWNARLDSLTELSEDTNA